MRLTSAHLPQPRPRPRPRSEIIIRPAEASDVAACAVLDTRYETSQVWQLDARREGEELRISLRPARLPRALRLDAGNNLPATPGGAGRRGTLWLVAQDVEIGAELETVEPGDHSVQTDGRSAPAAHRRMAGYLVLVVSRRDQSGYLRSLAVDPAYRRRGIGGRLLAAARQWAAAHGAHQLLADVPARNYPALRFLQKAGFTFCGYNDRCYASNEVALFFATALR